MRGKHGRERSSRILVNLDAENQSIALAMILDSMVVDIHSSVADSHSYKDNMEEEVGNMHFEEFVDIVEFDHMHLHSVVEMVAKKHFDFEY